MISKDTLLFPTILIFLFSLYLTNKILKNPILTFVISSIKPLLFYLYFNNFYDGYYTLKDDLSYIELGEFLNDSLSFGNSLNQNIALVFGNINGLHIGYPILNSISFRLFGTSYSSPVALNILFTIFIAFWGSKIYFKFISSKISEQKLFYLFIFFNPDLVVWSQIINIKDIVVLLLHVLAVNYSLYFLKEPTKTYIYKFSLIIFILFFFRYYSSVFFLLLLIITKMKKNNRVFIILLILSSILYFKDSFIKAIDLIRNDFHFPISGIFQFILTPIPFNTETPYEFLNIPSIFNWLLFPFMLYGIISIKTNDFIIKKYFHLYFLIFILFYSSYNELLGPRHRIQLLLVITIFQFIGINNFIKKLIKK